MSMRSAPDFALSFSSDAVHLMERADPPAAASVRWREKAVAAFDAPDFRAEMARLRKLVANGPDARVALIIPDDQILYTSLPVAGEVRRNADLGRALDGLTPYPVTDLAWDWRPEGEGDVRVAAVARQTLREAEDFARRHGFAAEGFLADPPEGVFPATPQFSDSMWKDAASLSDIDLPGDAAAEDVQRELTQATETGTAAHAETVDGDRPVAKHANAAVLSQAHGPEGAPASPEAARADSPGDVGESTDDGWVAAESQPVQGGSDEHGAVPPAGVSAAGEDAAEREVSSSALKEEGGQASATSPGEASGVSDVAGFDMDHRSPSSQSDHTVESQVRTDGDQAPATGPGASGSMMVASDRPASGEAGAAAGKDSPADTEASENAVQTPDAAGEQRGGFAATPGNSRPATATPVGRSVQPGGPGATSRLVADRASPPRSAVPASERMRVGPERPAKIEPRLDGLSAFPGRHPGARGGVGALLVMLGALLLGLMLIWAFATPGREEAPTAALPASGAMESEVPTSPAQEDDATAPAAEPGATEASAPVSETPVTQGATATDEAPAGGDAVPPAAATPTASPAVSAPATPAASAVEPARSASPLQPPASASPATPVREAVPAATPAQVPTTAASAASRDQAGSAAAVPEGKPVGAAQDDASAVVPALPAGPAPAQVPSAEATTEGASAPPAPVPADAATAEAGSSSAANGTPAEEPAADRATPTASAPTAASTPAASTDAGQGTGAAQGEGPSAAGPGAAPAAPATRPSNAPRRPARVEAPPPAQADQLPAVVPGRSALTRSERPSSRPATVRAQPSRATSAERPATTERAATTPPAASRPSPARPEAAPRAAPRPAASAPARPSSERPRPRPEEGSADESVTAAEMTAEERISADLMLADLYAANPWLPRLSTAPVLQGPRVAEARPARRPGGSKSAVDAAIAEAVSARPAGTAQGDRPVRRQTSASDSKPAAQAAAPVKAAANTSGRPAARPARGGSKPTASAVESAVAEAVATASRPATLASAASLVPVRKPARPAASGPAKDAEAEAVALAAATAIRPRPDPAPPAAAPAAPAAAQPAPSETAQRLRDEELQRQAEERARLRAQADTQAELQARAAAEARARAQAEAEERAAIAARGSYRPPEIDDEPEIAQKPVEGRTSADVAKNATMRGIETNKTQVIGVIGAGRASRGLIRLRNGKIVTVRLGDRIDGGAINSIGNGKISYVKGGRTYNLPILNGR